MGSLFTMFVSHEWPILMEGCVAATSDASRLFFIFYYSVTEILIINVLVGHA